MERFVIIVNGFQPLTIITKRSILDVAAVLDPPLIIVPIKKENGKKTIICKRFYTEVIMKELGIDNQIKELGIDNQINASSIYEYLPNTNKEALILSHSKSFLKNIQSKVNEVNLQSTGFLK